MSKTFFASAFFLTCSATVALGQTLHLETKLQSTVPLLLATTCERGTKVVGIGADHALYMWTLPSAQPRKVDIPDGAAVHDINCAGSNTLAAWLDGKAVILDLDTGKVRSHINSRGFLSGFGLSPDGSMLAISNTLDPVQVWDTNSGQKLVTGVNNFASSNFAVFSPSGDVFLSTDGDSYVRAYDRRGKLLYTADGGLLEGFAAVFTSDGKRFAAASADGTISLYDAASGKKLKTSASCGNPIFNLGISPDNRYVIALEVDDFTIKPVAIGIWDMNSENIRPLKVEVEKMIGPGGDTSHFLLIKQEDPKTLGIYSLQ